jgi:hypothetical protein
MHRRCFASRIGTQTNNLIARKGMGSRSSVCDGKCLDELMHDPSNSLPKIAELSATVIMERSVFGRAPDLGQRAQAAPPNLLDWQ